MREDAGLVSLDVEVLFLEELRSREGKAGSQVSSHLTDSACCGARFQGEGGRMGSTEPGYEGNAVLGNSS